MTFTKRSHEPGRPRSAEELLQVARRRGGQIRRRRRGGTAIVAACAAGGLAAALVTTLPGHSQQRVQVAGRPNVSIQGCPASPFLFSPVSPSPASGLTGGPGLSREVYGHLRIGQSTVLYRGRGASITLTRGTNPNLFAISLYAHGPTSLTEVEVLGSTTYFYPPGSGLPDARIPFRYPLHSSINDPCDRYQLIGVGVPEPALIGTAERFQPLQQGRGTPTSTPTTSSLLIVPNVVGQARASATQTLSSLGLQAVMVARHSASVADGDVIGEQPSAGSKMAVGSTVTLVVSSGPAPAT